MSRRHTELTPAVKGDASDYRLIELNGVSSIAGATIEAHVWRSGGTKTTLTATIHNDGDTLVDPSDKPVIRVELGTWLSTNAAAEFTYMIEYQVDFGDGRIWTWPSGDPDEIYVRAEAP